MTDERLRIWLSFAKFLFGAGGIGLVTTIVNWQIQQQELLINLRNSELEYLERFATGALHEDLHKRKSFAQYFATVSISTESRQRWDLYLRLIENEIADIPNVIEEKSQVVEEARSRTANKERLLSDLEGRVGRETDEIQKALLESELAHARASLNAAATQLELERSDLRRLTNELASLDEGAFRRSVLAPSQFVGVWKGEGFQPDTNQTWTIVVSLEKTVFNIEYPSLSCGGVLTPVSSLAQGELRFRENILQGIDRCVNYGSVVLSLRDDKEMKYSWYYPSGRFGAEGVLKKTT